MALGKGLLSLIPTKINKPNQTDTATDKPRPAGDVILRVDVNNIIPNPEQPRKTFSAEAQKELSDSIKDKGVLQPLVVTALGNGQYELIAGERRLQASKMAGLKTVPVIVNDKAKTRADKLELALIENIQRHDLNAMEKAESFKKLQEEFNLTQEQISARLGKKRTTIANTLRLLDLPENIQQALRDEKISEGHARTILALKDKDKQKILFDAVLKDRLSVRETEEAVKKVKVRLHSRVVGSIDPETKELENRLIELLGTKVSVKKNGNKGKILIEFYSEEELKNIIEKIH